ncbi:MAG: trypsin-like peptidase domain-containing protein [Phycisphaerae bacterium]|nr:trypsin-like peptidase domain-containing protein [Phycisphaerae bacterium]
MITRGCIYSTRRSIALSAGLLLVCMAAVCVCGRTLAADRVVLKGGAEIKGKILKSDSRMVVVDLGAEVVRLRRSDVAKILKDSAATQPSGRAETRPSGEVAAKGRIYRTAALKPGTIEAKAKSFGQAVVMVNSPGGQGSGFLISPDGYLITNYHVIAGETRIKITVFRQGERGFGQEYYKKVKIIALNPYSDLALLKIEEADKPFAYAYLGDIKDVTDGRQVFAIGNPMGLTRTVSQGIVSTKNRNYQGQIYIQTTTDINPGNSGGPLFNLKGEIIGVTSMGYVYLGGLNFAIPVDVVKRFIENRQAFAYDEDNPNSGVRYLQPAGRVNKKSPPRGKIPTLENNGDGETSKKNGSKK